MAVVVQQEAWWKRNLFALLAILFFLWVMFKPSGCGPSLPWERGSRDTISVKTETVYVPQPPVYIPTYIPQQSGSTVYPINIPAQYNPSQDITRLTQQYNDLVKQFLATKTYKDSIQLKDSSGTRVGVVNLNDVISENEFKSRTPDYQLNLPHTYTTITLREPPKNQVFVGLGITGNQQAPLNGLYGGLTFKNKKDRLYGIKAGGQLYNNQIVPQFGIETFWKIGKK